MKCFPNVDHQTLYTKANESIDNILFITCIKPMCINVWKEQNKYKKKNSQGMLQNFNNKLTDKVN